MTPITSILVNKFNSRCGQKMPFYIVGTFLSFPAVLAQFMGFGFTHGSVFEWVFYIILPILDNIGTSFIQIPVYSLVNSLTYSTQRRDRLISLRTGFQYMSGIFTLAFFLFIFQVLNMEPIN